MQSAHSWCSLQIVMFDLWHPADKLFSWTTRSAYISPDTTMSLIYVLWCVYRLKSSLHSFIHNISVGTSTKLADEQLPAKHKLKTAKVQQHEQSEDDKLSGHRKKSELETKKKGKELEHYETTSTTTKAVDWILHYEPRKYLLIKPGGKWYCERVRHLLFRYFKIILNVYYSLI